MAEQLPRIDETQRGTQRWHRDWYSYEAYQDIHVSCMEALYAEGLIARDTLAFRESLSSEGEIAAVQVAGRVICIARVVISVNKWLAVRRGRANRLEVVGREYSYHAWMPATLGTPRRHLFRYDNAHGDLDDLHLHRFDRNGVEIHVEAVRIDELPRLDFIIRHAVSLAAM